jgi:phosphoglycerol transferase MdoB-like AlkP superfamily enzyme
VAEQMVNNIVSKSDPNRPPVIILQSDHGARNLVWHDNQATLLQDYPEALKHNILFAMYIPGYSFTGIQQNLNPINTFPLIFNYLFKDSIPIK